MRMKTKTKFNLKLGCVLLSGIRSSKVDMELL